MLGFAFLREKGARGEDLAPLCIRGAFLEKH